MTTAPQLATSLPHGRNAAYDTLRGLLLVIMAMNHVPSAVGWLTRQPVGFFSAAEGFIFISGLVVGLVYAKRWATAGPYVATKLLWKRALAIYGAHVMCVASVFAWMLAYRHFTGKLPFSSPWAWVEDPVTSLAAALLLLNQPGLLDVLPTYFGLLLITPLALRGFASGKPCVVFAISGAFWALTNLFDPPHPLIVKMINTGSFNFFAWQLLYIIGLFSGWRKWSAGASPRPVSLRVDVGLLVLVGFLSLCRHGVLHLGIASETWFLLSNKNNLAPLRLINTLAVILLVARWLSRRDGRLSILPLAFLGRHSLWVFSVHCVTAIVVLGLPRYFEWSPIGRYLGPAVVVLMLFVAACVAEYHRLRKRKAQLPNTATTNWQPIQIGERPIQ